MRIIIHTQYLCLMGTLLLRATQLVQKLSSYLFTSKLIKILKYTLIRFLASIDNV